MNGANVFPFSVKNYNFNSAATTNATRIKPWGGGLFCLHASNSSAATAFLKFFDQNTAPNVGVDRPLFFIAIPASGHVTLNFGDYGLLFTNGISFCITALAPDADATAVGANDVKFFLSYQ